MSTAVQIAIIICITLLLSRLKIEWKSNKKEGDNNMPQRKIKTMKDIKIEYDGQEYDNIISLNRSYNYNSFSYLDDGGSEVNVYLETGKTFNIIERVPKIEV